MNYFFIDYLTRTNNDYCVLDEHADEVKEFAFCMSMGERALDNGYPDDLQMKMSPDQGGIMLTDFIENSLRCLIVSQRVKDVVDEHNSEGIEWLHLSIINHKGRVASNEYYFLNPIGSHDVLDYDASTIRRRDDGSIRKITKAVLDGSKLDNVPHIFRVKDLKSKYVISEALVTKLKALSPEVTNMHGTRAEINEK